MGIGGLVTGGVKLEVDEVDGRKGKSGSLRGLCSILSGSEKRSFKIALFYPSPPRSDHLS